MRTIACCLPVALLLAACAPKGEENAPVEKLYQDAKPALETINSSNLLAHIKVLSSDEFEGRAPGSHGEELSVAYITDQFKKLGLAPGNPDGTYVQSVPLIGFAAHPTSYFTAAGKTIGLEFPKDYVAVSRHFQPQVDVDNSDIVFVGYGVVAPEYGWDDYKGVDVRGKTLLMLINDPPVPDPSDPARLDSSMFKGRAMTYYGRWTYKYEIASEKGAAAAIIIHETGPAGYPYEVVSDSWGHENFDIKPTGPAKRTNVESWITLDKANELLSAVGLNYEQLKQAAVKKDFKPIVLNARATFHLKNDLREVDSHNVLGKLEGAKQPDEYVIYTAHWDHLGRDKTKADQIYHGALDNASGVASLIEIARAYKNLPQKPDRSILFLSVTGEEQGLLGAKYYANNPLYPLNKTLADINMDGVNQWGRTKDFVLVGYGNTTLDDIATKVARLQNRTIAPDAEPEKGFFYRSDHFEFAKKGVPALDPDAGVKYIGKPEGWGQQKRDEFTNHDYHKPTDVIKPDWDLSGAVEDLQLLFMVGYDVAQAQQWPEWKPGTEFKALREASLKEGK